MERPGEREETDGADAAGDEDPAPTRESDAERVTGEQTAELDEDSAEEG